MQLVEWECLWSSCGSCRALIQKAMYFGIIMKRWVWWWKIKWGSTQEIIGVFVAMFSNIALIFVGDGARKGTFMVAPMIAYGWRNFFYIFAMERDGLEAPYKPCRHKRRYRHVGRGLGKRTAVFFAGSDGILPHQGHVWSWWWKLCIVREFFGWLWRIFYCRDLAKHDFSFVVVSTGDAPCHYITKAMGAQY